MSVSNDTNDFMSRKKDAPLNDTLGGDSPDKPLGKRKPSFEANITEQVRKAFKEHRKPEPAPAKATPEGKHEAEQSLIALAARYAATGSNSRALDIHAREDRQRKAEQAMVPKRSREELENAVAAWAGKLTEEQRDRFLMSDDYKLKSEAAQGLIRKVFEMLTGPEPVTPSPYETAAFEYEVDHTLDADEDGWTDETWEADSTY